MNNMFCMAQSFNQDLSAWNQEKCTNMQEMFISASSFNVYLNEWNVANVKYMGQLFGDARSFNQDLSGWNVENVKDMRSMFTEAIAFEGKGLSGWKVLLVSDFSSMLYGATASNQDISAWDVSNAQTNDKLRYILCDADSFSNNLRDDDASVSWQKVGCCIDGKLAVDPCW